MRRWRCAVLLCFAGIFCWSCLFPRSPAPVIYYYALEYDPPPRMAGPVTQGALIVYPFGASAPYASRSIVYRDTAYKRDAYGYHQWRAHPGAMVADMIRRDLQHTGMFEAVLAFGSTAPARYALEGTVEALFADKAAAQEAAVLCLTVTLLDLRAGKSDPAVLFQKTYALRMPCQAGTPQSIVAAMSAALAEGSRNICTDVRAAVQHASEKGITPSVSPVGQ
ncbi:MAG: PqiC family protein [Desulfobacterota bacterium]|nr:PqiC family protein [Thermodesulfobacteriota bacterium]